MQSNSKEPFEPLNQQVKELIGVYRNAISHLNISENEFWIWYTLITMEGKFSQQDICSMWSLSKQTVNTIVVNLVKRNLTRLEVVPGTRNKKTICLTDNGRKYGERIVLPVAEAESRAFGKLPDEDKAMLSRIIGKYINNLKEELNESKVTQGERNR